MQVYTQNQDVYFYDGSTSVFSTEVWLRFNKKNWDSMQIINYLNYWPTSRAISSHDSPRCKYFTKY